MARIIGTKRADDLFTGNAPFAVVRGRAGDDLIEGGDGIDRLYGDAGGDTIRDFTENTNWLYGGRGDDELWTFAGEAWGGVGNDRVEVGYGLAVGGKGDDIVSGVGQLFGDEGPGLAPRIAGNDTLISGTAAGAFPQLTGGLGFDTFQLRGVQDGGMGALEVMDFTPGQDRLEVVQNSLEGDLVWGAELFDRLDTNDNAVLEWSDSIGPDGDWNNYDGSAVYTDGHTMYIGLNYTYAGPGATDAEDMLVIHGASQITAADWVMA